MNTYQVSTPVELTPITDLDWWCFSHGKDVFFPSKQRPPDFSWKIFFYFHFYFSKRGKSIFLQTTPLRADPEPETFAKSNLPSACRTGASAYELKELCILPGNCDLKDWKLYICRWSAIYDRAGKNGEKPAFPEQHVALNSFCSKTPFSGSQAVRRSKLLVWGINQPFC